MLVPMSYLENGSTLRSLFRLMPPTAHDADPARSRVLAYIMENMRCDIGRAVRAFNSMRNVRTQVVVFDHIHRRWRGCDWVPPRDDDKIAMVMAHVLELKRDISSLKSELRKVKHEVVVLRRRKGGRSDEALAPAPEAEQQPIPVEEKAAAVEDKEEWFRAMRAALDEHEREEKAAKEAALALHRSRSWDSRDPIVYPPASDEDEVS